MENMSNHLYAVRVSPQSGFSLGNGVLTYREEKLKVSMLLLEHVDGFGVAEEAFVIPRVARVMDLFVCPFIGEKDLSGIGTNVGESIKDVSRAAG